MVSAQGVASAAGVPRLADASTGLGAATLATSASLLDAAGAFNQRSNIQRFSLSRSTTTLGLVAVKDAMASVCFVMSTSASVNSKRPTLATAALPCVSARPSSARRTALNLSSGLVHATSICPLSLPSTVGSRLCARYGAASESGNASTSACTVAVLSVASPLNLRCAPANVIEPLKGAAVAIGHVTAVACRANSLASIAAAGCVVASRQPTLPPFSATLSTCTFQPGAGALVLAAALATATGGTTFSVAPVAGSVARRLRWPDASRATTRRGAVSDTSPRCTMRSSGRTSASSTFSESKPSKSRPLPSASFVPCASIVPLSLSPAVAVCSKSILRSASSVPACSLTGEPAGMYPRYGARSSPLNWSCASVLRLSANGVLNAVESNSLPFSTNASLGSVLISRLEARLLRNGTLSTKSRNVCVRLTVWSSKSTEPPEIAML